MTKIIIKANTKTKSSERNILNNIHVSKYENYIHTNQRKLIPTNNSSGTRYR